MTVYFNGFFCEDFRPEEGQKHSIMGVLPPRLAIRTKDGESIRLPKIKAYINVVSIGQSADRKIRIQLKYNDKIITEIALSQEESKQKSGNERKSQACIFPIGKVSVKLPGIYTICVNDGSETRILNELFLDAAS